METTTSFFYPYETTPELPQLQTSPDANTQQSPDGQGDEAHTPDDPLESTVSADGEWSVTIAEPVICTQVSIQLFMLYTLSLMQRFCKTL